MVVFAPGTGLSDEQRTEIDKYRDSFIAAIDKVSEDYPPLSAGGEQDVTPAENPFA